MRFFDNLNNKNKLGKYSLESDKFEIIKIKEVLKRNNSSIKKI